MFVQKSTFVASFLWAISACAPTPILTTTAFQPNEGRISGIPYFLPLAHIPLTISIEKEVTTITLEDRVLFPDATAALVANININSLSDDDVSIGTSNSGLLNFVTVSSEDVTDSIISDATVAVDAILQRTAQNLAGEAVITIGDAVPGRHFLDPLEPLNEPSASVLRLAQTGARVPLHSHLKPEFGNASILYHDRDLVNRYRNADGARSQTCQTGTSLCFPAVTFVTVRLEGTSFELERDYIIPDPTQSFGIRLDRRACVLSTYTMEINTGLLTKYSTNSPSEVAGCLSIPINIISSILAAPINAIRGQTAELEAQTKLIEAQTGLINAQNTLQSSAE